MLAALALPELAPPDPVPIRIQNYMFGGGRVEIAAGQRVLWTNDDPIVHKIVADGAAPAFQSPGLDQDDSFAFTFAQPGTYRYHCTLHPKMQGMVVVRAEP